MTLLFLKAYLNLLYFDIRFTRGSFAKLYQTVHEQPVAARALPADDAIQRICAAVDFACVWYWKEVQCLQRSVVTVHLLRNHGARAKLVIGTQPLPFKAHAWPEVEGLVVNDKPYTSELYEILDRC